MDQSNIIIAIKRRIKFKKYLVALCLIILISGVLSFFFYGFDATNNAIKFISGKDKLKNEKVMINPKIIFEYDDGKFVSIEANKAINNSKNDVELFDVKASGDLGNISAGNLLITNSGNDLHFSNNPVLIIKETKNE